MVLGDHLLIPFFYFLLISIMSKKMHNTSAATFKIKAIIIMVK